MKVKMKYKKSTLHTHVFEEVLASPGLDLPSLEPSVIPTLYIKKSAFTHQINQRATPQEIEVEVTYDE